VHGAEPPSAARRPSRIPIRLPIPTAMTPSTGVTQTATATVIRRTSSSDRTATPSPRATSSPSIPTATTPIVRRAPAVTTAAAMASTRTAAAAISPAPPTCTPTARKSAATASTKTAMAPPTTAAPTGSACERDARYHTPCVLPATSSRCAMAGVWSCVDGSLMCALTVPVASTEVCGDGLDQDCNGSDISCSSACTPRTEVCGDGIDQDCNGLDMACPSGCTVRAEVCGNGIDEDCNGSDLACTSTGRRTVYELYVPGDSWDPRSFRLRNGSWWGDENIVTCLNTGSQEMQSMAGGWHVCVTNGPVNPFIGSYRAAGTSSDLSTFDTSLGACAMASGILWRVHDEATGAKPHHRGVVLRHLYLRRCPQASILSTASNRAHSSDNCRNRVPRFFACLVCIAYVAQPRHFFRDLIHSGPGLNLAPRY
jgi:hypothetical protein